MVHSRHASESPSGVTVVPAERGPLTIVAPGPPTVGGPAAPSADPVRIVLERVPLAPLAVITLLLSGFVWRSLRTLESSTGQGHLGSSVALVSGLLLSGAVLVLSRSIRDHVVTRHYVDRIRRETHIDELTGLINRKGLTADIERRLAELRPNDLLGVLFCDLDRLKVINDSLGHQAGDEVLRVVANRLATLVRSTDSVGRFGGDEFVIVSSSLPTVRDLEILAGRINDSLDQPTVLADGSTQVVSGSIGIASVIGPVGATAEELLRDADAAMYQAKGEGGGRAAVFDAELRAEAVARLELEQELRWGIRNGEIEVHYQPIVDRGDTEPSRFEALVRWNHPRRGVILPSAFLPVAAESLLVVELGELVLSEACRQAVRWSEEFGRPVSMAVNIAERQLMDLNLIDTVTRVLANTGLLPRQLELEITEELIMERLDRSLVVLRQLDLLGVRLAIDDFGTSQASLSQLKKLAMVSTLKIDRLFVEGIADDEVDRKIVSAIVALAKSVGMSVVAEGVETTEQARILTELGVDQLQGFLFARPDSAERLRELLRPGR
ncbi:MAG: EAL domain-containing protein [Actinomycetota bacterium]